MAAKSSAKFSALELPSAHHFETLLLKLGETFRQQVETKSNRANTLIIVAKIKPAPKIPKAHKLEVKTSPQLIGKSA
jgi:hypothetical protein